ncbi:MAG: vitamin B12 transporter [Motiliproteus sp.]|jgi:vitamin B12 transporter
MLYFKRLPTAALALLPLTITATVSAATQTDQLVVTATRMAQTIDQSLVPVSVLTREDIDQSPATSLPELLSQLPGVDFSISGGYGKASSLYMRGTSSGHLIVLIDGVKIGSATLGSIPFESIPLAQVERIEVVRGPRSSLYGSEAIGGVIQIFTKKSEQGVTASAKVGAGNHGTQDMSAGVGLGSEQGSLSLNVSHFKTDGINAMKKGNTDQDGYENNSVAIGLVGNLSENTKAKLSVLHVESHNQYDSSNDNGSYNDYSDKTQQTLGLRIDSSITENLDLSAGVNQHRDESKNNYLDCSNYASTAPYDCLSFFANTSQFKTNRQAFDIKADYYLNESHILTLGSEFRTDKVSGVAYAKDKRDNRAVFAQWQAEYGKLGVLAGLRHDDDQFFGSENTGNLNLGYQLDQDRRILASYGTAFKAPTFNDLYYPFDGFFQGNPQLSPESSETVEVAYEVKRDTINYAARAFVTRIDDLIEWVWVGCFPCQPVNVQRAEIKGLELESGFSIGRWQGSASATLLDPRDRDDNKVLVNRARRTLQLNLMRSFDVLDLSASLLAQGERYADADNTVKLPGYSVANLKASHDLAENWVVEAKINNLFDKEYSTKSGFNSLDRTYLLSLSYNR